MEINNMEAQKIIDCVISPDGQITLPEEVRKILNVSIGDRISFVFDNDMLQITTPLLASLLVLQKAIAPLRKQAGLNSEEDIVKLCRKIRKENCMP
ncbi:MAG: AbrB/MazE/SpoVT family DNA-binding domain-containing protein [Deltaproteobacteria bacterium]|jgi:bifunctional DNA-binding transcriptional regulator/antitoxin component of YhaV-PrlF toxin-antitoxin module|nr:AbrB/MazE/SpoVT family DNA-binding domain-containing protein [Deltaproteobacteria bacterium]